ncbi:MAG: hypothetical protein ABEL76_06075 [Bradymonadaceae bacterium]
MSEYEIDFSQLPTDDEGVPYVEVEGETLRMPYHDLIEQNADPDALVESMWDEGIEYPIVVDESTNNVIDGMTRLYIADEILELPDDEIPIKYDDIEEEGEDEGWVKAISLNAQRRQISGAMRRELIGEIMDRSPWRKARAHVSDLARMLGVAKSTISRDLDQLQDDQKLQQLKKRKRQLNVSLTGMRNVAELLEEGEVHSDLSDDQIAKYTETLEELVDVVENEREAVTEEIEEEQDDQ